MATPFRDPAPAGYIPADGIDIKRIDEIEAVDSSYYIGLNEDSYILRSRAIAAHSKCACPENEPGP